MSYLTRITRYTVVPVNDKSILTDQFTHIERRVSQFVKCAEQVVVWRRERPVHRHQLRRGMGCHQIGGGFTGGAAEGG